MASQRSFSDDEQQRRNVNSTNPLVFKLREDVQGGCPFLGRLDANANLACGVSQQFGSTGNLSTFQQRYLKIWQDRQSLSERSQGRRDSASRGEPMEGDYHVDSDVDTDEREGARAPPPEPPSASQMDTFDCTHSPILHDAFNDDNDDFTTRKITELESINHGNRVVARRDKRKGSSTDTMALKKARNF